MKTKHGIKEFQINYSSHRAKVESGVLHICRHTAQQKVTAAQCVGSFDGLGGTVTVQLAPA